MEKGFESGFTVLLKFFENFCSSRVLEENYLFCENSLLYTGTPGKSWNFIIELDECGRGAGGGGVQQCKRLLHFFNRGSKNV